MAHCIDGRKLGRKHGPRMALFKSLIVAVLRYEQIRTTEARAKEIRGQVEIIITLAKEMGITVRQRRIPREAMYLADEVFLTGTAAEITPVRSVDKVKIGSGKRGPITQKIQEAFFKILKQEVEDKHHWLTKVS